TLDGLAPSSPKAPAIQPGKPAWLALTTFPSAPPAAVRTIARPTSTIATSAAVPAIMRRASVPTRGWQSSGAVAAVAGALLSVMARASVTGQGILPDDGPTGGVTVPVRVSRRATTLPCPEHHTT